VLDVDTTCTGARVVRWEFRVSVAGPIPIRDDRTFAVVSGETTVSGRFGAAGAEGTVRARHGGTNPGGGTYTCDGESTWTASTPPPVARAGRYCGFTLQGRGICLEVAADGRSVSRIASELVLRCGTSDLTLPFAWEGGLAITYDLRFRGSPRVQLPGGSAQYLVNGTFDSAGGAIGSFFVQGIELERDGVRQACRNTGARWSSRLGS
jgi:hypothetical protein